MYLEKIELNGFKSFANKTVLDFILPQKNKIANITAIVGPNGSGKSNIVDSIRWVMGEQSLKLLRGKKGEDVIFSGSSTKSRLGFAYVSLYLNNEDKKTPVDYPQIIITRKIYRSGENEYFINKNKVRLQDITILLSQTCFGQKSYSIIGQGMIDYFVMASAQDRKEFFEEASGIKPYQIKKDQALNKLKVVENNLENANLQLKEIEPRLRSLTRQVNKLSKRGIIEQNLHKKQNDYYSALWQEFNQKHKIELKKLNQKSKEEEELKNKVKKIQEQIAHLTKDSLAHNKRSLLQENYQKLLEKKFYLEKKLTQLKLTQATNNKQQPKSQSLSLETVQNLLVILEAWFKKYQEIKEKLAAGINWQELKTQIAELDKLVDVAYQKIKFFLKKKDIAQKELPDKTIESKQINGLNQEVEQLEQEIKTSAFELKKDSDKEKQEREKIWQLQQEFQKEQSLLSQASQLTNNIRIEVAKLETKIDDLKQEIKNELTNFFDESGEIKDAKILTEKEKREVITEIAHFKYQLELIGGIDPEIQKEYEHTKNRYDFLKEQSEDLQKAVDSIITLIENLNKTIISDFENSFKKINEHFQKYFKILFHGGQAKLLLLETALEEPDQELVIEKEENSKEFLDQTSEENPWDKLLKKVKQEKYTGIDIQASPPGKKLKSLNVLSGGERALTSIALVCAIISANPSLFVVLDEVDAALDESNSLRFAKILEDISQQTQFVIISHNRATMEKANLLYGVTMETDGTSKLLSLKMETAEKYTNR